VRFLTLISLLPLTILFTGCFEPKEPSGSIFLTYEDKEVSLSKDSKTEIGQTTVEHKDPNSGNLLSYTGFHFKDLLTVLKKELSLNEFSEVNFTAKDGYVTQITKNELLKRNAFLALKVSGYGAKGIYNESLSNFFEWRPGYLIFLKEQKDYKSSSPYQITHIRFESTSAKQSLINQTPKSLQAGAHIFFNTCNKCHMYKGYGGNKAPVISVLTGRWQKNDPLKNFLREPQKISGRNIEMSSFKGTDKELDELVNFLRSVEIN